MKFMSHITFIVRRGLRAALEALAEAPEMAGLTPGAGWWESTSNRAGW